MEWVTSLKHAINYMEENLLEDINADDVAKSINMSSMYLQKGFQIMTGVSIGEYIRNRRLYLAALDLIATDSQVIDIALKYGYETHESFTKAFTRYHNVTPAVMRKNHEHITTFLPMKINITVQGGNEMDYSVEEMKGFKVIGYERVFNNEEGYDKIPKFWEEIMSQKICPLFTKPAPENEEEETICNCRIGEYGVCIDDIGDGKFRYFIAGIYTEGDVPQGMSVYEFKDMEWAKFRCVGPNPGALQSMNTKIFKEWLPGNEKYEIATGANIEWYSTEGNTMDPDYESAIWVPVKRK